MRKLIVAVIIMFIGTTAFSQGIDLDLGIKAGPTFSNIRNLQSLNLKYKIGIEAGVFVGVKFSEKIGIQVDVLYSQQGATLSQAVGTFDMTYINVPVVLKYYLIEGQRFNFQIGPQFGILIDDKISAVYQGFEKVVKANETDIAGVIGFGYDFPLGVSIDGRYHLGFTDVSDDPQANGQHKYISLAIGYAFL